MADLTTLAAVKEYLGQKPEATTDDALLSKLVSRASAFICTYASRSFLSAEYSEIRDGNGSNRMILKNQNVTAVSTVRIDGQEIPPGSIKENGFWFNDRWIYLNGYRFPLGCGNVAFEYTAGYETVPADIEQVCIELVANKYKRKDRIGEVSKNLGGQVISYSTSDLSDDHKEILNFYESTIPV